MKKVCVLLLFLLLSLSLIVPVSADDYPNGWYSLSGADGLEISRFYLPEGVSVSLPDFVSLSPLEESVSFTAPIGGYVVGVDIPVGSYSVRCADGVDYTTVTFCRTVGGDWYMLEGLNAAEGGFIGKVDLEDGYFVEVRNGSAYFSAPVGIVFD